MLKYFASALCASVLSVAPVTAATLSDNFSSDAGNWTGNQPAGPAFGTFPQTPTAPPAIVSADANSDGDFLRLKDETRRAFTTLGFDALNADSYSRVSGSFDFRLTCEGNRTGFGGGGCADGFAFSLLDTDTFGSTGKVATASGDAAISEGSDILDFSGPGINPIDGSFSVGLAIFAPPPTLNRGGVFLSDGDRANSTGSLSTNIGADFPTADLVTGVNSTPGRFLTLDFDVDFESDLLSLSIIDDTTVYSLFSETDISQFGLDAYNSRLAFGTRSGDAGLFVDVDNIDLTFTSASAVAPVPVPAGLPLLLTSFGAFALMRRRRFSKTK